ncbi:hypothetical protein F5B22DRAFT_608257 [Xylaria bambusicola]|uniref:uncharacterized protein n=1 Tax=Xylaria bambusicola TaxID=326684 RepID=UPI0020074BE3|nr:uncharacterized protein F5B22DRAFT_608257 [Xylaria bambusicola]KAI0515089.1 hypothetical protein F5B22DRAFT_608257 [Xylaria bambusicola]
MLRGMISVSADFSINLTSLYAILNKTTYTFVAFISTLIAAVSILYYLRGSSTLRRGLAKDIAYYDFASTIISGGLSVSALRSVPVNSQTQHCRLLGQGANRILISIQSF